MRTVRSAESCRGELPVPVACKEASQLSVAYGGTGEDDGQKPPRNGKLVAKVPHLYGVIGAFA